MSWSDVQLGEIVEFFDNERIPLSTLEREKRQGEYRYYGAQGVIDYIDDYIFDGEYVLVAEDGANLVTRNQPIAFLVDGKFWVNNHAHILKGKSGLTTNYYIKSLLNNISISGYVTGAAQPKLNQKNLKNVRVRVPSYSVQNKIASILSAYDDLIENNNRRIGLLEESARLLYREWFVRLRFPGHENTRITHGVPEGWEKAVAFDAMDVMSGGTPKTKVEQYWNGDILFYTPKDSAQGAFVSETEKTLTDEGLNNCNSKCYPQDTLFITARGTVGNLNLAMKPMAMNQSCYALKGKRGLKPFFLYCAMKETVQHLKQHAVGAVFDAIVVKTFKMIPFLIPELPVSDAFEDLIIPTFNQVKNLMQQNQKLKTARDLLLPKLMNGEIPV